jgi:GH15 family glucan-1,4-alpha-glucosidase
VTTDGVLDWFCCPRFDSPSVFASLLDAERGGFYRIAPDRDDYVARQLYLPDTAVLITRFMTPDVMRFAIQIQPRFDYGRKPHQVEISEHGAVFRPEGLDLTVHGIAPEGTSVQDLDIAPLPESDGLRCPRTMREGESGGVVLESMGGAPRLVTTEEAQHLQDETERFWRGWLHRSSYAGRWREMVSRSAITLKLMTYAPTGALVAAPTTGCPSKRAGSATGTTATPGSGTVRFPSTRCSAWATLRRRPRSAPGSGTGRRSRRARVPVR